MAGSLPLRPARPIPADPYLRARDERLEALKVVVGKLAHDFNNFLVPQFGYVTLLREEVSAATTSAQYLSNMEEATRKTASYIDSILLGMRPHRQFAPTEFSFDELINGTLDRWVAETAPATVIQVKRMIQSCPLFGDEKHWRNAVEHLLSNARFALATGGELAVELTRQKLVGAEIERLGLDQEDIYRLTIRDTGFGMTQSVADRAFEPFFTTRTQIKAAGLGLTIVHSITQFHGGQVELRSAEEQGTTVTLWIPAAGVATRDKMTSAGSTPGIVTKRKKKVLLIEDDPLVKEVLRDWLGRLDLDAQVAGTANDAVKTFERKKSEWALVITEADLRDGQGEEIYERLSAQDQSVPWIFLAGRRSPHLPSDADSEATQTWVLRKPVTLRAFADAVRKQLAGNSDL